MNAPLPPVQEPWRGLRSEQESCSSGGKNPRETMTPSSSPSPGEATTLYRGTYVYPADAPLMWLKHRQLTQPAFLML